MEEENNKFHTEILSAAIEFSRKIMKYGDANSFERINNILAAYDPDLPNEVTMTLLRGDGMSISVKLTDTWQATQTVNFIKAVRAMTGLGLKESKDISDAANAGQTVRIPGEYSMVQRKRFEDDIRETGYKVV